MNHFVTIHLVFLSVLLTACGGHPPRIDSQLEKTAAKDLGKCPAPPGEHAIFSVVADGLDVGREVRTEVTEPGPRGPERVITSHLVMRMKMGRAHFDTRTVQVQRTFAESGALVRASHISMDQVTARTFLVEHNGSEWDRFIESRSAVLDPIKVKPKKLDLAGAEVIGLRLIDILRDVALGQTDIPSNISYYDPLWDSPFDLVISSPLSETIEIYGQEIEGMWVEASRIDTDHVAIRAFFDKSGILWVEEYPSLHQARRRMPGPLSLASETSELLVGLHSEAYIADPNSATRATFRLTSTPDRLEALDLLDLPLNQSLLRKAPNELILKVRAGAPDGKEPPVKADLLPSHYVQPKAPEIVRALRYLRSAGKQGSLSLERRYNATPILARASLIPNPKRFWSDPEQVAGIIMQYVNALLPDKRHTFSMADAVTTLERGAGDCTEHAVFFASLMRAHGIPTRLVTGMHLIRGGMWGYHMWNTYWNGSSWKSIDPSTMSYRVGAMHVALGRGSARFEDLREHLADFIWRTFSGISFDLIEASNNGEKLFLARPRNPDQNLREMALFNIVVLSERGDHKGAISLLDKNIPSESQPLSVKLMRIELLVRSGLHNQALEGIDSLRKETSVAENIELLDRFELQCLLTIGLFKRAFEVYHRIDDRLKKDGIGLERTLLKAKLLFGSKEEAEAIELLKGAIKNYPQETSLLSSFAGYVATADPPAAPQLLEQAHNAVLSAAQKTMFSDHNVLATLARVFIRKGRLTKAKWIIDHALILAPADRILHELRGKIPPGRCE